MHCDVNTTQIMRTSKMVARYTGIDVQANKAIVGKCAAPVTKASSARRAAAAAAARPEAVL